MAPATTDVRVPIGDGASLPAALAVPDGDGPHPGVVVLHEMWGLNDDMREVCGRMAAAGIAAIAPDVLVGNRAVCLSRVLLLRALPHADTLDHIEAARRTLIEQPGVDAARTGVIGFCMGGGFALLFATRGDVRVASVNYGQVPKHARDLEGVCPVVASYGGRDRIFGSMGRLLDEHLGELGVPHDVKTYDRSGHSFMTRGGTPAWLEWLPTPMRAGYVAPDAEDAWARTFAFFRRYLVDGPD